MERLAQDFVKGLDAAQAAEESKTVGSGLQEGLKVEIVSAKGLAMLLESREELQGLKCLCSSRESTLGLTACCARRPIPCWILARSLI